MLLIQKQPSFYDTFKPLISFLYFWSTKKTHTFYITIQWTFLLSLVPIGLVVSQKKKKPDNPLLKTFGPHVLFVYFRSTKKHTFFKELSNEHSYQVWFQLAQWFQRRFKTDHTLFTTLSFHCVLSINKKKLLF